MQIEVLGERYQLQDPIGRGGMATIYRGRDIRMDRVVAIKVLREVYSTDPKFVTRFQREAKAASLLQHPNIVQVYDYGQSDGNYFIVMELVEGTDLRRYLRSRGVLAIDRAIIIAHDVALGLGAAHRRNIVHRDVKPQNILVGRDGSIKLTDFGIASVYKDINAERLTTTGMTLGTVQYYAPEQAQGEIVSPAADVYALGIVMYEMLTGRTPFDGDTPVAVAMQHIQDPPVPPSQLNPNIPPALEEIILRCLEKVPEMRFRDGSALAKALELLGEDDVGATMPITPGGTPVPPGGPQQVPQRVGNGAYAQSVSSPDQRVGAAPYSSGVAHENGASTVRADQSLAPYPGPMARPEQMPAPVPYNASADAGASGATRPFDKNRLSRTGVVQDQRESRFASVITVLILLSTLLLLGFSIYLAGELHFLQLPWSPQADVSPTAAPGVVVPNLKGLNFKSAQQLAAKSGFTLKVLNGDANNPSALVIGQAPQAGDKEAPGSTIQVDLTEPTPTVTVPNGLVGPLANAIQILSDTCLQTSYTIHDLPDDPTQPPNMVTKTDPPSGASMKCTQQLTLYVVNDTKGATPTPIPTQAPTPTPTPKPSPTTTQPTPSPTTTQPTPSPTPNQPTPSPTPNQPTPSPTPKKH
jgi:serine/threonine protein kinase